MPEPECNTASSSCGKPKKRTSTRRRDLLYSLRKPSNDLKNGALPVNYFVPSSHQEESWILSQEDSTDSRSSSSLSDSPPERQTYSSEEDNSCTISQSSSSLDSPREKWSASTEELNKYLSLTYGFSSTDNLLRSCFDKKFSFEMYLHGLRKNTESLYTSEKWSDDQLKEFQVVKRKLNMVKNELDHVELNDWHRHTCATNPAALVMRQLRSEMKVEFLTQAWCKFYEVVSEFRLIPRDAIKSQKLYSIHLCEAPGAFVASLNHYLRLNHPDMRWFWKASTLNPYYEGNTLSQMINDDRFMLHTIDHWDFGADFSGDITHPDYSDHLRHECGEDLAHLVTADGSFDCQNGPNEQETSVSWLHMKETLTALRILRKGGHFVLKMFTFFECDTICLLYLLNKVFESVSVMKPATSKEGNSEVYVICKEYKGQGVSKIYVDELLEITEERHKKFAMFSFNEMSRQFINKVVECASKFAERQISVIKRNIRLFPSRHDEELKSLFEFIQEKLWQEFVHRYNIKPIPSAKNLVPGLNDTWRRTNVIEGRYYRKGSHADQVMRSNLPKEDIFDRTSVELDQLEKQCLVRSNRMPYIDVDVSCLDIKCGKPIDMVLSSQFCHGTFMRMRNELIETVTMQVYYNSSCDWTECRSDQAEVCDLRAIYADTKSNNEAQYKAFCTIYDLLFRIKRSENVILIGFPLFTQFNVNLLCVLNTLFDTVKYENPITLRLCCFDPRKRDEWANLENVKNSFTKDRAVLSFLPLGFVAKAKAPLHSWLVSVNNARVCDEICRLLTKSR